MAHGSTRFGNETGAGIFCFNAGDTGALSASVPSFQTPGTYVQISIEIKSSSATSANISCGDTGGNDSNGIYGGFAAFYKF